MPNNLSKRTSTDSHRKSAQRIYGWIIVLVSFVYLLNPTAGMVELLPDILPVFGNIDDLAVLYILGYGVGQVRGRPITHLPLITKP